MFIQDAELHILVPEGYIKNRDKPAFKKIWDKFNELIEYGESNGIKVDIDYKLDQP